VLSSEDPLANLESLCKQQLCFGIPALLVIKRGEIVLNRGHAQRVISSSLHLG
jgi:hypothetical protein